jgi:hypothetical protein
MAHLQNKSPQNHDCPSDNQQGDPTWLRNRKAPILEVIHLKNERFTSQGHMRTNLCLGERLRVNNSDESIIGGQARIRGVTKTGKCKDFQSLTTFP